MKKFRRFSGCPVEYGMRVLRQESPEKESVSALSELFHWNELECRIFLAGFGMRGLLTVTVEELKALGIESSRVSAFQMLVRKVQEPVLLPGPFRNSRQLFEHYRDYFRGRTHEIFLLLLLNGKNRVIRDEVVSEGSLTASLVHPREVFTPAVRHSAAAVIFLHNHPSGDPEPSAEDRQITERLVKCGQLLGVRVLDHVIIGDGCYYSFLDRGELSTS
ncbi:MAG TPA: DNA repair protein RadC [Acidobacteriota bacterium]